MYGTGECVISLNDKQVATQDVLKVNGKVMTKVFFRELPTATMEAIEDGEVLGLTVVDDVRWFVILYRNNIYKLSQRKAYSYYENVNDIQAEYTKEDGSEISKLLLKLAFSRILNNINNNKPAFYLKTYNFNASINIGEEDEDIRVGVSSDGHSFKLYNGLIEQVKEYEDKVGRSIFSKYSEIVECHYKNELLLGVIDRKAVEKMTLKAIKGLLDHSLNSMRLYGKSGFMCTQSRWDKEDIELIQNVLEEHSNNKYNYSVMGKLIDKYTKESEYSSTSVIVTFRVLIDYCGTAIGSRSKYSDCELRLLNGSLEFIDSEAKELGVTGTIEEMMSLESKIAQIKDKAYNKEILRANESNEIYRKFRAKADNLILIGRDLA